MHYPIQWSAALASVVALAGCGGSGTDGTSPIGSSTAITELQINDQQRASLQGDWQMAGKQSSAFIVRSSDEWSQVWAQRKAFVACNATAMPYNQAFCDSTTPPPIDFARYSLVALLINSVFYFDNPTPRAVDVEDDGRTLSVTYRFINPSTPTYYYTVTGRFFLVERTAASLEVHSKLCHLSC